MLIACEVCYSPIAPTMGENPLPLPNRTGRAAKSPTRKGIGSRANKTNRRNQKANRRKITKKDSLSIMHAT
ncbi:MAG: hypothetical protein QXZ02_00865 [Candidatus Bathyarchaeia archaeon]